jgi:hypothetical protein
MDRTLIVYRRERSAVWQCRYQVNRKWQRESTGEHELPKAIEKAKKIYITAEIRHSQGLPVLTRRVKHVAALAIKRMEDEIGRCTASMTLAMVKVLPMPVTPSSV